MYGKTTAQKSGFNIIKLWSIIRWI